MGKPLACASCGEAVAGAVQLVDGHLVGSCPGCGEEINMSLAQHAATGSTNEPEGDPCPKCGAGLGEAHTACPRCGLKRDLFADFASSEDGESAELAALWAQVEANWADDKAHERYVSRAVDEGSLASAARRYRAAEEQGKEGAGEHIARIRRMAEATLVATQPAGSRREPLKLTMWVLIALVFAAGVAAIAVFMKVQNSEDETEEPPPAVRRSGFPGVDPAETPPPSNGEGESATGNATTETAPAEKAPTQDEPTAVEQPAGNES